jgi:hypothetical protein
MPHLWSTREDALAHLQERHPSRVAVLNRTFDLLDDCIEAFELSELQTLYPRVCGLCLLKATNLAQGALSLILDGLGQEAGALMRPMIEYVELMTYFRLKPEMTEKALDNELPKAGERARAIGSMFKDFREHLNRDASHSSFSKHSIAHLFEPDTLRFKKRQRMVAHVLERNVRDLVVQLHNLLHEAILTLQTADPVKFIELASRYDKLKQRMFDVYGLNASDA